MDGTRAQRVVGATCLFSRVLLFDKVGVGLSDPAPKVRAIDDRAAEIEAVMDAAGFGEAVLSGLREGGPALVTLQVSRS